MFTQKRTDTQSDNNMPLTINPDAWKTINHMHVLKYYAFHLKRSLKGFTEVLLNIVFVDLFFDFYETYIHYNTFSFFIFLLTANNIQLHPSP